MLLTWNSMVPVSKLTPTGSRADQSEGCKGTCSRRIVSTKAAAESTFPLQPCSFSSTLYNMHVGTIPAHSQTLSATCMPVAHHTPVICRRIVHTSGPGAEPSAFPWVRDTQSNALSCALFRCTWCACGVRRIQMNGHALCDVTCAVQRD